MTRIEGSRPRRRLRGGHAQSGRADVGILRRVEVRRDALDEAVGQVDDHRAVGEVVGPDLAARVLAVRAHQDRRLSDRRDESLGLHPAFGSLPARRRSFRGRCAPRLPRSPRPRGRDGAPTISAARGPRPAVWECTREARSGSGSGALFRSPRLLLLVQDGLCSGDRTRATGAGTACRRAAPARPPSESPARPRRVSDPPKGRARTRGLRRPLGVLVGRKSSGDPRGHRDGGPSQKPRTLGVPRPEGLGDLVRLVRQGNRLRPERMTLVVRAFGH